MYWPQRLFLLVLASLFGACTPAEAFAQGKQKFEKVRITTVDGVDLTGYFYASTKKKNPPTVLMLHALGEDSKKKNWVNLAEALQDEGFAVLTFDFRGHGNSTTISDTDKFLAYQANRNAVKGKIKDTLEFKNIQANYYTLFCNDVAAARVWLDRQNDTGTCNVSNLFVIGAESGATIGSIWLNSEWRRVKLNYVQMGLAMVPMPDKRQEGKDVIAAVWLSMSPTLGKTPIPVGRVLDLPAKANGTNGTPMVFMYGEDDTKGKDYARQLANGIKKDKDKDKFRFTDAVKVKGTKLGGQGLLLEDLGTGKAIVEYLNNVLEDRNEEWFARDFRKTDYVWMNMGGATWTPANIKGGDRKNLNFDTYSKFIPQ